MKLLFTLFFLLCGICARAQDADIAFAVPASQPLYPFMTEKYSADLIPYYKQAKYLKRRRGWAVGGVLCLAAGAVGVWIGAVAGALDGDIYKPVFVPGCALVAASIPMFVLANVNKRKAKRAAGLSLNVSNIEESFPNGTKRQQPALGISINF